MDGYALRTTRSGAQSIDRVELTLYDRDNDWTIHTVGSPYAEELEPYYSVGSTVPPQLVCVGPLIKKILVCQLKGARLDNLARLARLAQLVGVAGQHSALQIHQTLGLVHNSGGWRLLTLSMCS